MGSPEMIRKASKIVVEASRRDGVAVVVSAFQGVTDQLLRSAKLAASGSYKYKNEVESIKKRHIEAINRLVKGKKLKVESLNYVENLINELNCVLEKISERKEALPKELDLVASFGERLSAFIVSGHIQDGFSKKSYFADAREFVKTDDNFINAAVDFNATNRLVKKYFSDKQGIPVITGFLGSTKSFDRLRTGGETTTLGRGGSDYSAAIIGAALGVEIVEIWTDVDGILSADPKLVKNAVVLKEVSYEEAVELAYFGAKVIHPATMLPAVKKGIPIVIKNTFNPAAKGTLVLKNPALEDSLVKGITSVDDISLVIVGGVSLIGIPGSAARIFDATRRAKANVILISQASSEHTVCLAIKTSELKQALDSLKKEFKKEIKAGSVNLSFISDQAIIAVVGDKMRGTPGISGKLFQALGDNKINITAIAQGGSERNISLTVGSKDKARALNLIHDQYVYSGIKNIFLIGTGNIGGTLLRQISEISRTSDARKLRVCGIINDKKMLIVETGIDLSKWQKLLEKGENADLEKWLESAKKMHLANKVLVDCTASEFVAKKYIEIAEAGFNIATPNKKFNVLPLKEYKKLREVLAVNGRKFMYETNVGAGLPVISTIRDLIASGDKITKIEGIFSGTLSYIFSALGGSDSGGNNFSEIVAMARKLGYTEPDPREDLGGQDVGRKLLILAREAGLEMEMKDVKIENLVPKALQRVKAPEEFLKGLEEYDDNFTKLAKKAEKSGKVLRYVAKIQKGPSTSSGFKASAKLEMIPKENPLAHTGGADNIFAFYTKRYKIRPLVVQGPGAGAEVTAGGVLADILKI